MGFTQLVAVFMAFVCDCRRKEGFLPWDAVSLEYFQLVGTAVCVCVCVCVCCVYGLLLARLTLV